MESGKKDLGSSICMREYAILSVEKNCRGGEFILLGKRHEKKLRRVLCRHPPHDIE